MTVTLRAAWTILCSLAGVSAIAVPMNDKGTAGQPNSAVGPDTYYFAQAEKVAIQPVAGHYLVKLATDKDEEQRRQSADPNVQFEKVDLATISSPAFLRSHAQLRIYDVSHAAGSGDADREVPVLWKTPAYRIVSNGAVFFVTNRIIARFNPPLPTSELNRVADQYGITLVSAGGSRVGRVVFEIPVNRAAAVVNIANAVHEDTRTIWATPEIIAPVKSSQIGDPTYPDQWHLHNDGSDSNETLDADVDAPEAWALTTAAAAAWHGNLGSAAIIVSVQDPHGVETGHEDLTDNALASVGNVTGPHGTACAGVAVARANSTGVRGVAPFCSLFGLDAANSATAPERFDWSREHGAAVISNSWSIATPYQDLVDAIDEAATEGREGRGCVVFFAAGNDFDVVENKNPYAALDSVVCVGASTSMDVHAAYSNRGASDATVDVVAPSGPAADSESGTFTNTDARGQYIRTCDQTGTTGYNSSIPLGANDLTDLDYTELFSGTSSATPLAAGVGALVLAADPDLTASEVKEILYEGAERIDQGHADYARYYGNGRVNAYEAVSGALLNHYTTGELRLQDLLTRDYGADGERIGAGETLELENLVIDEAAAAYIDRVIATWLVLDIEDVDTGTEVSVESGLGQLLSHCPKTGSGQRRPVIMSIPPDEVVSQEITGAFVLRNNNWLLGAVRLYSATLRVLYVRAGTEADPYITGGWRFPQSGVPGSAGGWAWGYLATDPQQVSADGPLEEQAITTQAGIRQVLGARIHVTGRAVAEGEATVKINGVVVGSLPMVTNDAESVRTRYLGVPSNLLFSIAANGSNTLRLEGEAFYVYGWGLTLDYEEAQGPAVNVMPEGVRAGTTDTVYAWAGDPVEIWGNVAWGDSSNGTYEWDFDDGSPLGNGAVADPRNISVTHTYATAKTYYATLTVTDANGLSDSDSVRIDVLAAADRSARVNKAITRGLKRLYLNQRSGGHWGEAGTSGSYYATTTAMSLLAFENRGHLPTNDPDEDIYAETVRRGFEYLHSQLRYSTDISPQAAGDPDKHGVYPDPSTPDGRMVDLPNSGRSNYEHGIVMMAFAGAGPYSGGDPYDAQRNPALNLMATITDQSGGTVTLRYYDILANMVDYVAWAQADSGWGRGGWRYSGNQQQGDNSVAQWPAIGCEAAEYWGLTVPPFVKEELLNYWVPRTLHSNGGWGYTDTTTQTVSHQGAGICMLSWCDVPKTDDKMVRTLARLDANWTGSWTWTFDGYSWSPWPAHMQGGSQTNYYAMYGIAKGCRIARDATGQLSEIALIGSRDWYDVYIAHLLGQQQADGSWPGSMSGYHSTNLNTPWALLVLEPTIASLRPVAEITASPNPTPANQQVLFDLSASYHQDPTKWLAAWQLDFENDGVWDDSGSFPVSASVAKPDGYPETGADYTVTALLRVTDNTGDTDEGTVAVRITTDNVPPVANAGEPYNGAVGVPITFDGSASFDPNAGPPLNDAIVSWEWDLDGDGVYDDGLGESVAHVWNAPYVGRVYLKVTDTFGASSTSQAGVTVTVTDLLPVSYPLVSRQRVSRYIWAYTFEFVIANRGNGDASDVVATLNNWPSNVTAVLDDSASWSAVSAGATATSDDTFELLIDRSIPVANEDLTWILEYTDAGGVHQRVVSMPLFP